MSQYQRLMQALNQAKSGYGDAYADLLPAQKRSIDANTQRHHKGLFGMGEAIYDAVRRPKTDRTYNEALIRAQNAATGVDDIAAQLQAMQQQMEQEELQGLYQQHGMGGPEAALRAKGADVPAQPKEPELIQIAKSMNLQPGSPEYNAFMQKAKASGRVTVNTGDKGPKVGTIPPGYELHTDPTTGALSMVPIAGGPVEAEQSAADRAGAKKTFSARTQFGHILDVVENARNRVGPTTTGVAGSVASRIPGSQRLDLEGDIRTLQSAQTLDSLQELKSQSATGASGLGQMSDREGRLLAAKIADLDPNQSDEKIGESLDYIEEHYQRMLDLADGKVPDAYSPERLKADAQAAIDGGADPQKVTERLERMLREVEALTSG